MLKLAWGPHGDRKGRVHERVPTGEEQGERKRAGWTEYHLMPLYAMFISFQADVSVKIDCRY